MKLNKIISSLLAFVMLFAVLVGVIPAINVGAVYDPEDQSTNVSLDFIKNTIVKNALNYDFETAEEMLNYEKEQGFLVSSTNYSGEYTIFVNRYTGVLYYRNNLTGQILTSTPSSFDNEGDDVKKQLLSQIVIEFEETTTNTERTYYSSTWAANYGQISTELISGGIRVNYILGDTATRFLLPMRMIAEEFESLIFIPLLEKIEKEVSAVASEEFPDTNFSIFDNEKYETYEFGYLNASALNRYGLDMTDILSQLRRNKVITVAEYNEINTYCMDLRLIANKFFIQNPASLREGSTSYNRMIKDYYTPGEGVSADLEIFKNLTPIYAFDEFAGIEDQRTFSAKFQKYASDYTFTDMYADEAECGYVDDSAQKPVFRCSLEYTFNADGSLSVRLPANSITFDETVYILKSIAPLTYFGAGDMTDEGYAFYPDGSGTIVEYEDFYGKANIKEVRLVYGTDYSYSKITGKHHEQVTMPVFGMVGMVNTNATTSAYTDREKVNNGFFAIIEEGSALASITFRTFNNDHKYAYTFCSYTPYPSDEYDLSDQISVGGSESYTMTAETKYSGSYVTRYVMLADEEIMAKVSAITGGKSVYYPASYVGMATYYREFLKANGTISALESTTENLPLYIEALGSMEIIRKILSFPVTTKLELTTFDDIYTMYEELSGASAKMLEKAAEYDKLAEETDLETLKASYKATADKYRELSEEVTDIANVNFRLTGFGNGGMYATYPTKVRWDKAVGGAAGFEELLRRSAEVSAQLGANLGIYPDYDFMYLTYTEAFDGISVKGNVSRMIDNRYASKQTYNSVLGMHESFFTLVINPAALDKLYSKFVSQYSKYPVSGVSVSTMGSDLNSNFDEDETVNRDDAMTYVQSVMNKMAYQSGYQVMTNVGNSYSLKYVDHIIEAAVDSSHLRYTSYTVPFVGMVLHGYVNYTGSAINYAGNAEYDILRSIESGASLYYILCYRNSSYLKDDDILNDYYGIDYDTWFDNIVTTYHKLNSMIGDLQRYEIVDHKIIIGERVITDKEVAQNLATLKAEMLEELAKEIQDAVNAAYADIRAGYPLGTPIKLTVDYDAIMEQFALDLSYDSVEELNAADATFKDKVKACIDAYVAEYDNSLGSALAPYEVSVDSVEYQSRYSYLTDSVATDKDYVYTDFTSDVGNIVLVTYSNGVDTVKFILNYNIYSITVNLGDGNEYKIDKYSYVRIDEGGNG